MPILVPTFPTPTYIGNIFSCTAIIVDAYSPVNYTPANVNLCGHLSGIDTKLGVLTAAIGNISCTTVNVNTFTPSYYDPATNVLCAHLQAIDVSFGSLDTFAPQTFNKQLFTDGDNGQFNANITGMTSTGLTLSQDNTITHETTGSSLKGVSTASATQSITHTNGVDVINGKGYEFSTYVYIPVAAYPNGAVASITCNGTGAIHIVNTVTVSAGTAGYWKKISARYYPNADQTINISILVTGFTIATSLNFDNLVVAVNPTIKGTQMSEHYFTTVSDTADAFNRIADNFTSEGGTITTSGVSLAVTIAKSVFWLDGLVYYQDSTAFMAIANNDNYLFYDSFNDRYLVKSVAIAAPQPPTNDGELILWKITTDFVGTTGTTDIRNLTPFGSLFIADRSITTIKIALNAVTDAEMSNTAVTPGSYVFTNLTVSTTGRITAAANGAVITSPLDNDHFKYDAGSGTWINDPNVTIQGDYASLVDNSWVDSSILNFSGVWDSNPAVGPIVPTIGYSDIQLMWASASSDYRLAIRMAASERMSITNSGFVGIGTTTPNNFLQIPSYINFDNSRALTTYGYLAGNIATTGAEGVYMGYNCAPTDIGGENTMVGAYSAESMTGGTRCSYFGRGAGRQGLTPADNSFFGSTAGYQSTGSGNTFVGSAAGTTNVAGANNTALGFNTLVGVALSNATAIGYAASVTTSNSLVLGMVGTNVGIGVTAPLEMFQAGANATSFRVVSDGRIYGTALHNNAGAVTGTTNQYIASGTWTPTLTNVLNVAGNAAFVCQWMRVGNLVTVCGLLQVTPTGAGLTEIDFSFPIASTIAVNYNGGGAAVDSQGAGGAWSIETVRAGNNRFRLRQTAPGAAVQDVRFTATYLIL